MSEQWVEAHGRRFKVETLHVDLPTPTKKRRPEAVFTKFPRIWEEILGKERASGTTYAVAIILLHEAWRQVNCGHKPTFKLTSALLKRGRVGDRGKRTALARLEQFALISVDRKSHRNPIVTVYFFQ
jgi:hypothetical protein